MFVGIGMIIFIYMALLSNCFFKTAVSIKEKVSSPLSAQILEFYESELFPEALQNLEVASTSNCCYQDPHHQSSSYMNLTFPPSAPPPIPIPIDDDINYATNTTVNNNNSFSIIFEDDITADNDINLDFSHYQFGHDEDQFDLTLLQLPLTTDHGSNLQYPHPHPSDHVVPVMMGPAALPTSDQDDCFLSSMPPTSKMMRFDNPSSSPPPANCSFINSNYSNPLALENSCSFNVNNLFLGNINEIQPHQLDFKGDIFCSTDPLPPPYNSNQLQALSNESQHHGNGNGSGSCATPSEMTSLEAETMRVANKLTTEERKEKIHRYMKKRNQRNFSKKIKYACRKTLADSRPRVRGRFAKNDEFGENMNMNMNMMNRSNHEEDTDEDVKSIHVAVKEEEDNLESSSEMLMNMMSEVNSLKRNYPAIHSWMSHSSP